MNKKYVDFDTIQSKIESLLFYENACGEDFNLGYDKAIFDVLDILADMPTADVQEVRHGHWIREHIGYGVTRYKCSVCGGRFGIIEDFPPNKFCPDCGTRMDGEEE